TLPATLAHERRVNPISRADLPHVRDRAEALSGKMLNSSLDTFVPLRELKNQYRTK
ncbi:hydroxyacylglutathione hydrolase, partial [Neisseria meningitidis]|uniref:hydroxyacylglutathione hydrolase C-terminal domain-containing protein n=1 Tax=Neisseria meningitidis TaxID=487 RepID=UPI000CB66137